MIPRPRIKPPNFMSKICFTFSGWSAEISKLILILPQILTIFSYKTIFVL